METVVRNIREMADDQRSAAEQLVGHALREDQQLVIQVRDGIMPDSERKGSNVPEDEDKLPEWCNVYEGLTDEEIAALEKAISRRLDLTRPST
jgi:hypothetical protein